MQEKQQYEVATVVRCYHGGLHVVYTCGLQRGLHVATVVLGRMRNIIQYRGSVIKAVHV